MSNVESGPHTSSGRSQQLGGSNLRDLLTWSTEIATPEWLDAEPGRSARETMTNGWSFAEFPLVDLTLPIDWDAACAANRSWAFHLHTWSFMDPMLREYAGGAPTELLEWCLARAKSWSDRFVDADPGSTMAWYDMSLALRAPRLAHLIRRAAQSEIDPGTLSWLLPSAQEHRRRLELPEAFNPRNNHGYYTALGQLVFAHDLECLPGMTSLGDQGRERIGQMAATQFLADGGHAEHSPDYHRMLLADFERAESAGLISDPDVIARLRRARYALGWMVQPDGYLVQFGDTASIAMTGENAVASGERMSFGPAGGSGSLETRELAAFPASGYAFVRSPAPLDPEAPQDASYLALMTAFHSRAHKHADDSTIVWYDRGLERLIDAGRFGYAELLPADSPLRLEGYYYGTPERRYVESTRAHNTVEHDGRDHERRNRKPFGSGLGPCDQKNGHFRLTAQVDHGSWTHSRTIVFKPGDWLAITDDVASTDQTPHDFRTWFNMPGEALLHVTRAGNIRIARPESTDLLWMTRTDDSSLIPPARGETTPVMRGWRSRHDREVTPAWSTGYLAGGVTTHRFEVLFNFGTRPRRTRPAHPFERGASDL